MAKTTVKHVLFAKSIDFCLFGGPSTESTGPVRKFGPKLRVFTRILKKQSEEYGRNPIWLRLVALEYATLPRFFRIGWRGRPEKSPVLSTHPDFEQIWA